MSTIRRLRHCPRCDTEELGGENHPCWLCGAPTHPGKTPGVDIGSSAHRQAIGNDLGGGILDDGPSSRWNSCYETAPPCQLAGPPPTASRVGTLRDVSGAADT